MLNIINKFKKNKNLSLFFIVVLVIVYSVVIYQI
jgi:hypothetical protein